MNDYVVAAFVVTWFVVLVYVAALAMRSARTNREVQLLTRLIERQRGDDTAEGGDGTDGRP